MVHQALLVFHVQYITIFIILFVAIFFKENSSFVVVMLISTHSEEHHFNNTNIVNECILNLFYRQHALYSTQIR